MPGQQWSSQVNSGFASWQGMGVGRQTLSHSPFIWRERSCVFAERVECLHPVFPPVPPPGEVPDQCPPPSKRGRGSERQEEREEEQGGERRRQEVGKGTFPPCLLWF